MSRWKTEPSSRSGIGRTSRPLESGEDWLPPDTLPPTAATLGSEVVKSPVPGIASPATVPAVSFNSLRRDIGLLPLRQESVAPCFFIVSTPSACLGTLHVVVSDRAEATTGDPQAVRPSTQKKV